jgi:15-cis-phytoene synthase
VPPGTTRYWSWLFAAAELRAPLLGIYALGAEWQALLDPTTEASVAHLKLAWWREEMRRLAAGSGVHPISGYLAGLPRAASADFAPLLAAIDAAAAQVGGVPLERGADLERQSQAWGGALALASLLAADVPDETALRNCTAALAAAGYLSRAIRGYRREARAGRVPFAIDELMATTTLPRIRRPCICEAISTHCAAGRHNTSRPRRRRCRERSGAASGTCWCLPRSGSRI